MAKYLSERQEAVAVWLEANGIRPADVPADAELTIEDSPGGRLIRCEVFHYDSTGRRQIDDTGCRVATTFVTVPLAVEPPQWWQPWRKPSRDDLLDTVAKLRRLAGALDYEATAPGMHEAARETKRDASRRIRTLLPAQNSISAEKAS